MAFSESFLQELTDRNDINDVVSQYVKLTKRSGANLFGLCPFHNEKTPSFSVSRDKQIYHCFGCGKGGGVINFIMDIENLSFPDAVRFLAKRVGMVVPDDASDIGYRRRERMLELNREAARFFHECLNSPGGVIAAEYISKRKISPAMVTKFGIGYAPDTWDSLISAMRNKGYSNAELLDSGLVRSSKKSGGIYDSFRSRLIFPIIDVRGSVIGFSGRILGDGEPKYLNSPETLVFNKGHNLFALNLAKKSKKGYLILSEGNIDVVALHQAGLDCAVASLGTSLTAEQARLMSNYTKEVVIGYDSDSAGQKAARRAISVLEHLDLRVRVLRFEGAKDPDEYIKKFGAPAFENLVLRSENHIDYLLSDVASKYELNTDEGRVAFVKDAVSLVSELPSPVEREVYSSKAAEIARVSSEVVNSEVKRVRKKKLSDAKRRNETESLRVERLSQPKSKNLHYNNIRSAKAEEGILGLICAEPSLLKEIPESLYEEDFSSPVLGHCFETLKQQIQSGGSPSLPLLADRFTSDEMSLLADVVNHPHDMSNARKAIHDYIEIINTEKLRSKQGENPTELKELAEKLRQSKGYGRK